MQSEQKSEKQENLSVQFDTWADRFEYEDGKTATVEAVSSIEFYSDDLDKTLTIKGFLKEILLEFWSDPEAFKGKRPFGNSGWDSPMIFALAKAGLLNATFYEDDETQIKTYDREVFNFLINTIIKRM